MLKFHVELPETFVRIYFEFNLCIWEIEKCKNLQVHNMEEYIKYSVL